MTLFTVIVAMGLSAYMLKQTESQTSGRQQKLLAQVANYHHHRHFHHHHH